MSGRKYFPVSMLRSVWFAHFIDDFWWDNILKISRIKAALKFQQLFQMWNERANTLWKGFGEKKLMSWKVAHRVQSAGVKCSNELRTDNIHRQCLLSRRKCSVLHRLRKRILHSSVKYVHEKTEQVRSLAGFSEEH